MTSANPPITITSIYNASFFTSTPISITLTKSDTLYLKKTTADTATALETFSGIAIGGSNNITLGNGTVAPTSTQLGYTVIGTNISSSTRIVALITTLSQITLSAGTWLMSVDTFLGVTLSTNIGTPNGYRFHISDYVDTYQTTIMVIGTEGLILQPNLLALPNLSGFCIISQTASSRNYYLCADINLDNGFVTAGNSIFKAVRLA